MDLSLVLLAGFVVFLTTFALSRGARTKNATYTTTDKGERVIRAADSPDKLATNPDGVTTVYESFAKKTGKDTWGEYQWKNYTEVNTKANQFGFGLVKLGAQPGDRIGIFSKNREEWFITQQACFSQSLVIVSFYETLGKESIRYVADHSEISIAICDGGSLQKLFEVIEGKKGYKGVKHLVVMDEPEDIAGSKKYADELGVSLHIFSDVDDLGFRFPAELHPPKPSDLCTIMYTSGTTDIKFVQGTPKGVLLTHSNLVAELVGVENAYNVPPDTCHFSYLPLAHIFERVIMLAAIHKGGNVGFFHGDIQGVPDDMKVLKPTVFVGVPKIFDRTKDAILKQVQKQGAVVKLMFNTSFALKKFALLHAQWLPLGILDVLVFNKTKAAVGGNVKIMVSAGAPLSLKTEIFLRVCFGIPVSQGYGLTETCGAASFKRDHDTSVGHLGGPLVCNEFKLEDLPDMGYSKNDKPNPRGELCIRGYNIANGYYKDKEKTAESFKEGGWFLTGDIAEIDAATGSLSIIDRKKNLLKLAQGEYVAVEQVEDKLTRACHDIEQIFVHGDSQQSTLVAIVVPKKGAASGDDKQARENWKKQLVDAGKKEGLLGFEIPRNVWLSSEQFTQENDLMTPTMKLKRNVLKEKFKNEIAKMYQETERSGN